MAQIFTPENFGNSNQFQSQMSADILRIAVGIDMLVGLLSEKWGYELKEVNDEHGNTIFRWRAKDTEATEGEGSKLTNS